jgi:hypothetical protein
MIMGNGNSEPDEESSSDKHAERETEGLEDDTTAGFSESAFAQIEI